MEGLSFIPSALKDLIIFLVVAGIIAAILFFLIRGMLK